uniref:GATA-type domain-containing protein n=1 Tax=Macrostomum lignano TaxID=282301 RepID=A0A1I8FFV3_9PLAT
VFTPPPAIQRSAAKRHRRRRPPSHAPRPCAAWRRVKNGAPVLARPELTILGLSRRQARPGKRATAARLSDPLSPSGAVNGSESPALLLGEKRGQPRAPPMRNESPSGGLNSWTGRPNPQVKGSQSGQACGCRRQRTPGELQSCRSLSRQVRHREVSKSSRKARQQAAQKQHHNNPSLKKDAAASPVAGRRQRPGHGHSVSAHAESLGGACRTPGAGRSGSGVGGKPRSAWVDDIDKLLSAERAADRREPHGRPASGAGQQRRFVEICRCGKRMNSWLTGVQRAAAPAPAVAAAVIGGRSRAAAAGSGGLRVETPRAKRSQSSWMRQWKPLLSQVLRPAAGTRRKEPNRESLQRALQQQRELTVRPRSGKRSAKSMLQGAEDAPQAGRRQAPRHAEDRHAAELTRVKELHAAAEKLRREKWEAEKTKKIKELTVKASSRRFRPWSCGQLAQEKDAACARERGGARQRYESQLEAETQALEAQRKRMYAEVQEEKDRLADTAARQRQELDRLRAELADTHSRSADSHEERDRRHEQEMRALREALAAEKQAFEQKLNLLKRQESTLLRRERDKEIELVLQRLEADTSSAKEEAERSAASRVARLKEKFAGEVAELERSERQALEKYNQIKARNLEVEGELERLKVLMKQKEVEIDDIRALYDKLNRERKQVSEVVRQEFADRLVRRPQRRAPLRPGRERAETQEAKRASEEEMEGIHRRVKEAIRKKDVVNERQQYQTCGETGRAAWNSCWSSRGSSCCRWGRRTRRAGRRTSARSKWPQPVRSRHPLVGRARPENSRCAECLASGTTVASLDTGGTFACNACAIAYRKAGLRTKSIERDRWQRLRWPLCRASLAVAQQLERNLPAFYRRAAASRRTPTSVRQQFVLAQVQAEGVHGPSAMQ